MNNPNAVILARVSSKSQEDEGYSLDSQLKLLKGYCDKNGYTVIRIFKIAETASKEQSRKIFHEMLEYLSKAKVHHLAIEKTDRFTRNFRDAVAIDDWLEKDENRRLHAVKENLVLHKNAKSDVKFMWNIHLSVAKKYTDNLREEAMKGWAEKLAQGWLPAPPPPGYMTVIEGGKRIHVPDPETGRLIKDVFRMYLSPSHSTKTITREMELMGIRTRNNKPYSSSYVHKMLSNPFYIGINRFNGKDYQGAQELLLTKDVFDAVQQKLHQGRPAIIVKHNPIFKCLIRCEDCETLITWQLQKGRYYGVCKKLTPTCNLGGMLREDRVEEYVIKLLKKLVCPSRKIIEWTAEEVRSRQSIEIESREKLAASIQTQIDRIDRMEDGLYEDKLSGEISQNKYEEKRMQFIEQKKKLCERLEKIGRSSARSLEHKLVLLELSQKAAQIYPHKTPEQKRFILSKLFSEITVKNGTVSVKYTKFAEAIAKNVQITHELMEANK